MAYIDANGVADTICPGCGTRNCKGHPEQGIEYLPGN